ncbi:uncharacterized protein LOC133503149 [Syngnathoides biaculeatus]|uniref:uncharacterized protein LOC133503149 n=1 Tax=Syngnathoides biaculeatus TaxID=300417 RepID=UPI002ADDEE0B|nr:uncharacterized protein LOC133503149 [Syngnathoides biaculeatus]
MCATSVKKEYEEQLCRLKEENGGQRLLLDAGIKTARLGSHRADVNKNIFHERQASECPCIKVEVEEEPPDITNETRTGRPSAARSERDDITAHSFDTDEDSKGFGKKSDYTGTTNKVGTGCGNKDQTDTEHFIEISESTGSDPMDPSTSPKESSSVCEINTEQPVCLAREILDKEQRHEEEADSFSYTEENFACETNTEHQSSLSLEMLDAEKHQAEDSFSYTEEAFMCQMHKPRSAESFHSRELPQHQRDLIVERYQSGEGYKRISKGLNIPWNTVKSVIVKWRKNGTTVPLPRTGRPSKIDEKTRRELVREAVKRPTATLKELQEFLASTGCSVHVTTISRLLHMSGLWGRVAR